MNDAMGPVLAVGGVIVDGDRVVLVRRGQPPMKGRWSLPGGRVACGERLEEALRREVFEETGLEVVVERLIEAVEIVGDDGHYVVLDYRCRILGGQLQAGDDATDAVMVSLDALDEHELTEAVTRVVAAAVESGAGSRPGGTT